MGIYNIFLKDNNNNPYGKITIGIEFEVNNYLKGQLRNYDYNLTELRVNYQMMLYVGSIDQSEISFSPIESCIMNFQIPNLTIKNSTIENEIYEKQLSLEDQSDGQVEVSKNIKKNSFWFDLDYSTEDLVVVEFLPNFSILSCNLVINNQFSNQIINKNVTSNDFNENIFLKDYKDKADYWKIDAYIDYKTSISIIGVILLIIFLGLFTYFFQYSMILKPKNINKNSIEYEYTLYSSIIYYFTHVLIQLFFSGISLFTFLSITLSNNIGMRFLSGFKWGIILSVLIIAIFKYKQFKIINGKHQNHITKFDEIDQYYKMPIFLFTGILSLYVFIIETVTNIKIIEYFLYLVSLVWLISSIIILISYLIWYADGYKCI